jgi:hypothetical protein
VTSAAVSPKSVDGPSPTTKKVRAMLPPSWPNTVVALLAQALSSRPEDRPTAHDLGERFERAVREAYSADGTRQQETRWPKRVLMVVVAVVAMSLLSAAIVLVGLRWWGPRFVLGDRTPGQDLGAHATVDAVGGFQNSRVFLSRGDRVTLDPEGRIHLASDQAYHFARAAKPFIIHYLPDRKWSEVVKQRYPFPELNEGTVFYRDWIGPTGDSFQSDILEECKLRRDLNWGTLLAAILPGEASPQADPYEVLLANKTDVSQLLHVPGRTTFVADRDGWLTFIVNDAVVSPYSSSKDARDYYEALKLASQDLTKGNRHRIPLQSLPLVWYSDNLGAFRIKIDVAGAARNPSAVRDAR